MSNPAAATVQPRILVVTGDLLAGSRLAGLAGAIGARLEQRGVLTAGQGGEYDIVLLDLQGLRGPLAPVVGLARSLIAARPTDRPGWVVAFGPHVADDRLRAAVVAGCDEAVSRGELLGGFANLVRRWLG